MMCGGQALLSHDTAKSLVATGIQRNQICLAANYGSNLANTVSLTTLFLAPQMIKHL